MNFTETGNIHSFFKVKSVLTQLYLFYVIFLIIFLAC